MWMIAQHDRHLHFVRNQTRAFRAFRAVIESAMAMRIGLLLQSLLDC